MKYKMYLPDQVDALYDSKEIIYATHISKENAKYCKNMFTTFERLVYSFDANNNHL